MNRYFENLILPVFLQWNNYETKTAVELSTIPILITIQCDWMPRSWNSSNHYLKMSTPIFVPYDAKTGQHDFLEALLLTHLEIKSIKGYENFEWVSDTTISKLLHSHWYSYVHGIFLEPRAIKYKSISVSTVKH